ncbi:DUF4238 domain-containing protein [Pseudomonas extremorientalis]|uniref:DUF4238 domain-containing protein n=1 Tax=Pseudomonas extremorientalis TaxID=169669 RepID=UPI0027355AE1|nr:DUF4238 domain-containing protein [Pseudomonas extremorientalis]WLG59586.1 DUF4238 domain-containing protein [Pseudomonas extremorientalis]
MTDQPFFDLSSLKNKKRQHYVSRFYLDLWMTEEELHVTRLADQAVQTFKKKDTQDIAVQNYFYNLEMDSEVWETLSYMFGQKAATSPVVKKILEDTFFLKAADDVLNRGVGIVNDNKDMRQNAQEILRHLKKHQLEDAYEKIETAVSSEIKEFSKSNGNHLLRPPTAETFRHLLIFYCFQLFRTKQKITQLGEHMTSLSIESDNKKTTLSDSQKQAVLKCMLFINSYELCEILEKAGCVMRISINKTEQDFITTDCPAMYFDKPDAVPGFKAYGIMPLSPRLIMNLCIPDNPTSNGSLLLQNMESIDEVIKTNDLIRSQASEFIFSTTA